jgi:hypothetical protein
MKNKIEISEPQRRLLEARRREVVQANAKVETVEKMIAALEAKRGELGVKLEKLTASFNKGNLDVLDDIGSTETQLRMIVGKIEEVTNNAEGEFRFLRSKVMQAAQAWREAAVEFLVPLQDAAFARISPLFLNNGHGRFEANSSPLCLSARNALDVAHFGSPDWNCSKQAEEIVAKIDELLNGENPFQALHDLIAQTETKETAKSAA